MVKTGYGLLELGIQNRTIGYNHDRIKNRLVVVIMKACEAVGCPGNRIGLPRTGTVLYEIVFTRSIGPDVPDELPHDIHLMIPGENNGLFGNFFLCTVLLEHLFPLHLNMDKFLEDIQQAVLLQNILPEIRGHIIPIRRGRVPCSAVTAGTVAALVKREKIGLGSIQFGRHHRFIEVYGKKDQDAVIEPERRFPGIAVEHPLLLGVIHTLAGQLVL